MYDVGEALEVVAHKNHGCCIAGSVQSQAGQGFEQCGLVEDNPAHGKENGIKSLQTTL